MIASHLKNNNDFTGRGVVPHFHEKGMECQQQSVYSRGRDTAPSVVGFGLTHPPFNPGRTWNAPTEQTMLSAVATIAPLILLARL